jgi:hypothetical protein
MKRFIIQKQDSTKSSEDVSEITDSYIQDTDSYTLETEEQEGGAARFKSITRSDYKKSSKGSKQDNFTKEDIKKIQPKGPMPGAMKKAPATGMKTTAKKAAAKPMAKPTTKAPVKTNSNTGQPIKRNKPGMSPKTPTKTPVKKKVVQMPSKISPSKMTPAQKAKYLQNPERYDG